MPDENAVNVIWNGSADNGLQPDLLRRRHEAEQLIAYIESVANRQLIREDKQAFTLAVNAPYGEGKTFFLRRLAKHLELNHPVAYVDAWADDLEDEPLTALAATLSEALEPLLEKPAVKTKLNEFMSKAGKVAKIVGWGLARRGAGLAITATAVDAVEDALSGASEDLRGATNDGLADISKGSIEDVTGGFTNLSTNDLMLKRVDAFKENKKVVREMKDSLKSIVDALDTETNKPPIIIIIDELDRCRPTYSIKLLEEIKHLFDVPGLVFILGLHSDQLGHSVSGAYGSGFDGHAYLRRFIDREYQLAQPGLEPLLELLFSKAEIDHRNIVWPDIVIPDTRDIKPSLSEITSEYMRAYGLTSRDAFYIVDIIRTSLFLSNGQSLNLPYFLPLAFGLVKGLPEGQLPSLKNKSLWRYMPNWTMGIYPLGASRMTQRAICGSGRGWAPLRKLRRIAYSKFATLARGEFTCSLPPCLYFHNALNPRFLNLLKVTVGQSRHQLSPRGCLELSRGIGPIT